MRKNYETARVGKVRSLRNSTPLPGEVTGILLRPGRREDTVAVETVVVDEQTGLEGDHFRGGGSSKRQVTLIGTEDLASIASFLGLEEVTHGQTRRNILTTGINLLALKNRRFHVGDVLLEYTGQCSPCSLMEKTIGTGAYQAMRYHGGIIARVITGGQIECGDAVKFYSEDGARDEG
ncbi:MAG: MOSC domain-containing protein [Rhodothermales bacterium]|nr:MOSC domain-containing protein [Rhodothermales bacterium]